jgi:c-di-GMP-binding flagellar brake protein YcgR
VGSFDSERREFIRISTKLPVQYRYFCDMLLDPKLEESHDGDTRNLSGGGLLLRAKIPQLEWLPHLLAGKMHVGVTITLTEGSPPLKALTRVAWIEGLDEATGTASLGLVFREITREAQDAVLHHVIRTKIP